jgi:hypothetical protein
MTFDLNSYVANGGLEEEKKKPKTVTKTQTSSSNSFDLNSYVSKTAPKQSNSTATKSNKANITTRKPSLLNPVEDVYKGVKKTIPQLPQMAVDMGKSAVKNLSPSGALNTAPAIARGALTGIVDLPGSVAGLGVDIVNSIAGKPVINMPEERRRPIGTALEQWRSIQDTTNNLAKPAYPGQDTRALGIKPVNPVSQWISGNTPGAENAQFAESMASFLTPTGALGAGVKGSKIAKETARITSKLNNAQKAKYASQINKLAKKNITNNIKPLTPAQEVWKNTKLGTGLGALEGEGLEEKAGNAFGGGVFGGVLSGMHIGGKKAWNSAKGKEIRAVAKTGLDILADQYDSVSQAIAFADSTLKTNLAKKGSVTDKRKQFLDLEAKNESLKKNISNEYKSALDESGTLNKREQKKVRNINQYGEDLYNKQTDNGTKDFKENAPVRLEEDATGKQQEPVKQNYEFIPEDANEPMKGNVPQQEIKPQKTSQPSTKEKIKRTLEAKKAQKETNNFKFPEEEQSQASESNLSHVKEQGNTISPKEEQTPVKNDSGMSNEIKQQPEVKTEIPEGWYKDEFGHIVKDKAQKPNKNNSLKKQSTNTGVAKAGNFQDTYRRNNANKKLKEDLKNGNFKPSSMKDKNLESVVKLEPGEAQGANELYKLTEGKENIFENVEKEKSTGRTSSNSYSEETIDSIMNKYEVMPDGETIVYKRTPQNGKKGGKKVPYKEIEDLRKRLQKESNKNNNVEDEDISTKDRTKAEIEEAVEDEVYYDKYNDNLSPTNGEGSTGVERFGAEYKSNNPEFVKWYNNYKNLPEKAKGIELKRKLQEFKNDKKGLEEFYDEFVKQEESDLEATRQKKLGDEYSDTSDIKETEKLSEAVKDTEFEFEEKSVEETKKGISASQRKFVDDIWNERLNNGKKRLQYAKGRLNTARDSKSAQKVYDDIINEIKSSKQSTLVKQIMIEDFNKIADEYLENKKRFGTEINKVEPDIAKGVFSELSDAVEKGDLAKAGEIIENNNLKIKYSSPEQAKILKKYYEERAAWVYQQAENLGFKLVTEQGGAKRVVYDPKVAYEWCVNKAKLIYKNNPEKLKMELSSLKKDYIVKRKVTAEYKKIINKYENILRNDVEFAYDRPQTALKEIEGAKGTDKQWEQRKTGDVWNNKSSNVYEGKAKADETIRALKSAIEEPKDTTKPAISGLSKELAKPENRKVVNFDTAENTFKGKVKSAIAKIIFSNFRKHAITVVTKDVDLGGEAGFRKSSGEIFVKEGLPDDVTIAKTAHEYMHKYLHEAAAEGGQKAVNALYQLLGAEDGKKITSLSYDELMDIRNRGIEKGLKDNKLNNYEKIERRNLQAQKAVAKLNELLDNNSKANEKYRAELKKLYDKYGQDYVEDTIKLSEKNINEGLAPEEGLSEKQINIIEQSIEIDRLRDTEIENFCNEIESKVLDEQRQGQIQDRRPDSNTRQQNTQNKESNRRTGSTEGSEQTSKQTERNVPEERRQNQSNVEERTSEGQHIRNAETDVQSRRTRIDDLELSTKTHKVFDFFKKRETKNNKNNPINKIDNGKVKRITDVFKEVSTSRENDFKEYGTYPEEQLKNRLYQQSITGEGIYTLQSSKSNGKLDLSKEKKQRVGFTYEKTKQGLNHKGTVESDLALNLADQVKRSSARDKVEFLKENFSKKVKGYVPVNSKLLWNAIYFGKSKAWYEIVSKGKKSIKEFFDEKSANAFEELYNRVDGGKADIYVPKDIFDLALAGAKELPLDYIKNYGRTNYTLKEIVKTIASGKKRKIKTMTETLGQSARYRMKGMVKLAGATLDFYNDRFKRKVLTSASFVMNNRIGNQIMLMSNADSIGDYINSFKEAKNLKEDSIPREILESTLSESLNNESNNKVKRYFSEENSALETFSQIVDGQYVDLKTVKNLPSKILYGASNLIVSFPNDIFKRISHRLGEINERVERFERKQAASLSLKKMQRENVFKTARSMATVEELAKAAQDNPVLRQTVVDRVNNILGDYNNFNKTERTVLKRIQPFYSWNRTIIRHILNLYKEDPVKATLILYENWKLQHQDDGLEDYQHGAIKLPFKNERTGTNIIMNKTKIIPVNTPFELLGGESLGTITNAIKKPLEAIRGEKFFKPASEITSKKWKRATRNKVKGYYNNKTGEFREGSLPASVRLGYLAKDYTELVYPMMGSPVTKGTVDAIRHKIKTGELLFPDKQYDADFGSYYDGDVIGKTAKGKERKASVKNKLDFKYQALNKYLGLGIQPERAKEEVKEKKRKFKNKSKRYKSRYKSRHKSRY